MHHVHVVQSLLDLHVLDHVFSLNYRITLPLDQGHYELLLNTL